MRWQKGASLLKNTAGSISLFVALGMMTFVGVGGIATDTARSYLVKSRLSTALDSAGLAGGWSFFLETRNEDVTMFFNANYPDGFMGSTVEGPFLVVDEENETLTLSATATVPTLFMRIFGQDNVQVSAFVEVTREMQALDTVIAMDMSGSMGNELDGGTRISAARNAATELINILFGENADKDLLNIGVVPWNGKVNILENDTTFTPSETVSELVGQFTNPVSSLPQNTLYTVNNSPVPLLWPPHETWKGCVYSRFIDDSDEDTNADVKERQIDNLWVEWPGWEPIGPGGEQAASNGSDIEIIQTTSRANKGASISVDWPQTPKRTNILIALSSRLNGSNFGTPPGWISVGSGTADDGGDNGYMRVFARLAGPSETTVTLNAATTSHQGLTILEVANLDWNDLVDNVGFFDHSELARNDVDFGDMGFNNSGNLLLAMASFANDGYSGYNWTDSFTTLNPPVTSADGTEAFTHAVGFRRVTNNGTYDTRLRTTSGPDAPAWGMMIGFEDRHVCSSTPTGGECTPCLRHGITPLSNSKTTVQNAINDLRNPEGTTNITQGLGWAWRVLTPEFPYMQAVANPDYNREQAIVLLTDGENFAGTGDGYKTAFGQGSGGRSIMDERLRTIATNIKNDGVVIYVIQFANNGTALQSLLKEVASGPDSPYYHYAPDSAALRDVFREVANHLSQLRLSK